MKTKLILGGIFAFASIINVMAQNTATGTNALFSNTTGSLNTATGSYALYSNTVGNKNTATGDSALYNSDADHNTAVGASALFSNTSGTRNVAIGVKALYNNTTGNYNIAVGDSVLYSNTGGSSNLAYGLGSLRRNTLGSYNVSLGGFSLYSNTTGGGNTASGFGALFFNTTAIYNTAYGAQALYFNTQGEYNTASGPGSLANNSTGSYNTAFGYFTLLSNTTGSNNSGFGRTADVAVGTLTNATAIGYGAIVDNSDKVRIGDVNVSVIEGQVDWSFPSDGRFKNNISEQDVKGLEFIKRLRPVVYNFDTKKFQEFLTKSMPDSIRKNHMNKNFKQSTAIRQSGFIAQEVEKAAEEIGYNFNGVHKPSNGNDNYSLSYGTFVVPLVKAVQEQQEIIERLEQKIADLQKLQNIQSQTGTGINSVNTDGFSMEQNEPNPFTHETLIRYSLPQTVNTAYLAVYDLSGKQVASFPITEKGTSSLIITSDQLAAGIYIYSIVADNKIVDSKRMVIAEK